jgi:hypothetical protein
VFVVVLAVMLMMVSLAVCPPFGWRWVRLQDAAGFERSVPCHGAQSPPG